MHRCKGCSNKNTGECHRWCMVKMRNIRKLLWSSKDNFVLLYSGVSLVWEIGLGHFLEKEWLEPLQLHSLIRYPSSIVSSQFFPLVSHRHNRTNKKKKHLSILLCKEIRFPFISDYSDKFISSLSIDVPKKNEKYLVGKQCSSFHWT